MKDVSQVNGHGIESKIPLLQIADNIRSPKLRQIQFLPFPDHPGGSFLFIQQNKGAPDSRGQGFGQVQGLAVDCQVQVVNLSVQEQFPHRSPYQIDLEMPICGQTGQNLQGLLLSQQLKAIP